MSERIRAIGAIREHSIILLSGKTPKHIVMLLPFQGATAPTRDTQGAASLALGSVLHWPFRPHLQSQNGCLSIRGGQ